MFWKLGRYYRTYDAYVEEEVKEALELSTRGTDRDDAAAFVVEDANYVSARWPGDAYPRVRGEAGPAGGAFVGLQKQRLASAEGRMVDNLSLRAVRLWLQCGDALAISGKLEESLLSTLVPALSARQPVKRVVMTLRWRGDRQLGFELEAQFQKATPLDVDLDGTTTHLASKQSVNLGLADCDGAFAAVSGKTFRLSVWHNDPRGAVGLARAEDQGSRARRLIGAVAKSVIADA